MLKWKANLFVAIILLGFSAGCSIKTNNQEITRSQASSDPPYFAELYWPSFCDELPEGCLVIIGRLVCPGGFHPEIPMRLFVFPSEESCPPIPTDLNEGGDGKNVLDPLKTPYIKGLVDMALKYSKGYDSKRERQAQIDAHPLFLAGCQMYSLFLFENNEYTYLHVEDGRFRLDFDQWCRFNPGTKVLILVAEDAEGQAVTETNIYTVPDYAPDVSAATVQVRNNYGTMMTDFGNGMLDALNYYPDTRSVDIAALNATVNLFSQAYLGTEVLTNYVEIGENYRTTMQNIADNIPVPDYKETFLIVADWIADQFVIMGYRSKGAHFQYLWGEEDPIQNFWNSVDKYEGMFNWFPIQVQREIIPEGGIQVTLDIQREAEPLAHIVMTGSPLAPLSVTGQIGNHSISEEDYNPSFLMIFGLLYEAGFVPATAF